MAWNKTGEDWWVKSCKALTLKSYIFHRLFFKILELFKKKETSLLDYWGIQVRMSNELNLKKESIGENELEFQKDKKREKSKQRKQNCKYKQNCHNKQ